MKLVASNVSVVVLKDTGHWVLEERLRRRPRRYRSFCGLLAEKILSSVGGPMSLRPVKRLIQAKPTLEGAGVHLRRAFGFGNTSDFDPFLLLDDFRNDIPEDYLAGFPWHPHRGIETITYVLSGTVEHGDSMGNRGTISSGDAQWDDRRQWHYPSGDAQGRSGGANAWFSIVGESSSPRSK